MQTKPADRYDNERYEREVVSIRDHFEARCCACQKRIDERFAAMDEAKREAYSMMEKRLDGMNEFRLSLRDQASQMVGKVEFDLYRDRISSEIKRNELSIADLQKDVLIMKEDVLNIRGIFWKVAGLSAAVAGVIMSIVQVLIYVGQRL